MPTISSEPSRKQQYVIFCFNISFHMLTWSLTTSSFRIPSTNIIILQFWSKNFSEYFNSVHLWTLLKQERTMDDQIGSFLLKNWCHHRIVLLEDLGCGTQPNRHYRDLWPETDAKLADMEHLAILSSWNETTFSRWFGDDKNEQSEVVRLKAATDLLFQKNNLCPYGLI